MSHTQKVFDPNAVSVRHINPSIMEGERGQASILGAASAVRIRRFAPEFTTDPSVSGSFKIPSVLTCNPGVFIGSPQPVISYQWQGDGADIDGETGATITTVLDFDTVDLTCDVLITNDLGTDTASSNGITASLIEPVRLEELTFYAVTGLNQPGAINMMTPSNYSITGVGQETRVDMMSTVAYIATGMWVEDRVDFMTQHSNIISGLNQEGSVTGFELQGYTIWQPSFVESITIVNPSAETGNTSGWTVTAGTVSAVQTDTEQSAAIPDGAWFFKTYNSVANATMNQVITLGSGLAASIDSGNSYLDFSYIGQSLVGADGSQMLVQFLNSSDVVLGTASTDEHTFYQTIWDTITADLNLIPPNTRKINIIMRSYKISSNHGGFYDDIKVDVYSDVRA